MPKGCCNKQDAREDVENIPPVKIKKYIAFCPQLYVIVKTSSGQKVGLADVEVVEHKRKGKTDKKKGDYNFGQIDFKQCTVKAQKAWYLTPKSKESAQKKVKLKKGERNKVTLILDPIEIHMYLDADRDGKVDDKKKDDWKDNNKWECGKDKKGAIILCNNDNDDNDIGREMDYENDKVDTKDDLLDIAPLVLKKHPKGKTLPKDWKVVLSVFDESKIRIFDKRTAAGVEKIGPDEGKEWDIEDLDKKDEIELGMEATQYPDKNFNGMITLTLALKDKTDKTVYTEEAKVRVAPWIMFNHFDPTKIVYVVDKDKKFVKQLHSQVKAVGGASLEKTTNTDRWMQDVMEIGFSTLPNTKSKSKWHLPVVLRTAADRSGKGTLEDYPENNMLGPGFGFTQELDPSGGSSLDSFGNLECTPPFTHKDTKKEYKFGRIYYGEGGTFGRNMYEEVRDFLDAQKVQEPIPIDTDWLIVGHVDEIISFCPMKNAPKKFKVLLASPDRAIEILKNLKSKGLGCIKFFKGVNSPNPLFKKIKIKKILASPTWRKDQKDVQKEIDKAKGILQSELGLEETDFISLPVLFREEGGRYVASSPGVVNMLVLTKNNGKVILCIPKPFGPRVFGKCQFEKAIKADLGPPAATGVKLKFIDDFETYHEQYGEIHCGTNSTRKPPEDRWWWEQEGI
jgi:protein-arginine deiminase